MADEPKVKKGRFSEYSGAFQWGEGETGGGAAPYDNPPEELGPANPGTVDEYARGNHRHAHGDQATSGNYAHDTSQVENLSNVPGADTTAALNALLAGGGGAPPYTLPPEELGTPFAGAVNQYSRGDHVHAHGDQATSGNYPHDSDQTENLSNVAGANVTNALNTLQAALVSGPTSWLEQARSIVQNEVYYRAATTVLLGAAPGDLQTAITAAADGDVLEVAVDATYSPILIPPNKKLTIRVRQGFVVRLAGANCLKLSDGTRDLVVQGLTWENYSTADVNGRGAGVCFDQDLSRAYRVIFYACNWGEVTNGSAVLLSYRVGGGYAGQYLAATQSDRVAFLSCNWGLACKDGNEGAALCLRGWDYPAIADCQLRGGAQALAATDRGVALLACRFAYVQGCTAWTWYHPTNGEAYKLDWFGTPNPDFRCSAIFENCNAANCGEGFDVDDGSDALLMGCVATHAHLSGSGDGFDVDDTGRAVFAGCVARDCDRGWNLEAGAIAELENCEAYGCTTGYLISNGYVLPTSNTTTPTREDNGNLAAAPSDATPQPPGVASPGTSPNYSRGDHVHAAGGGGGGSLAYAGIYVYFPDTGGAPPGPFLTGPGWFGLLGVHGPASGITLFDTPNETIFTVPVTGIYRCGLSICSRNQDGHRYEIAILVNTGFVNQATYEQQPVSVDPERETIAIDTLISLTAGDQVMFAVRDRDWVGLSTWVMYSMQAVMHQLDGLPGGGAAAYGWAQENTADPGSTLSLAVQNTFYPWITAVASTPLLGVTFGKDAVNGDYLQANAAGVYEVKGQVSFQGTVSQTFEFAPFVNATNPGTIGCERKLGTGGDVGSASFVGILSLSVGDRVNLRCRCTSGAGASIGIHLAQLAINRLS